MRVPQVHLRHRAAERQVLLRHVVLVLCVGLDEGPCGGDHGGIFRFERKAREDVDYTGPGGGSAAMAASQMRVTSARSGANSSAGINAGRPASARWCAVAR